MTMYTPPMGTVTSDELYELLDRYPEMRRARGVTQDGTGHRFDVLQHSLEVLRFVRHFIRQADKHYFQQTVGAGRHTRGELVELAAFLHDVGKPETREVISGGRATFHGHDKAGARMVPDILLREDYTLAERNYVANLVLLHLRPAYLIDLPGGPSPHALRRLAHAAGRDLIDLMTLALGDFYGKRGDEREDHEMVSRQMSYWGLIEKVRWQR